MAAPNRTMFAVLGFLSRGPMSGYDLKKAVESSVGNFWKESYGQLYPILRRLADDGLAEKNDAAGGGKRARHVYSITATGRRVLREWLEEPTEPQQLRNELLLKLFFGGKGETDWSRRQVERSRERLAADLQRYKAIHGRLERDHSDDADFPYWEITLRYGERETEALIDWCDETLAALGGAARHGDSGDRVMATIDTQWDVIVVGSGLGGLTAAARMARAGLRVLVLEQHVFAGGYAHHFLRKVKGTDIVYDFDVALHQTGDLTPGRSMHKMLTELGVLERIGLNRFDIAYRTRGPAHDLQIPADAGQYERLLCDTYPEHAAGVHDLFATLREIDKSDGGVPSAAAMATMGLTLQEFVDSHVRDERITSIFATLWGYLGLVPSKVSAFMYAMMWNSYHMGGCYYVRGGGQALSDAFVGIIEENHGKVLLNTAVTRIETEGGRVTAVQTERRGTFRAPVVVSNASAPLTFHRLLDDPTLGREDRERVDSLPLACSIHQAYVGIRGDAFELGLRDRGGFYNVTYDLDAEWDAVERGDYRAAGWLMGNHNLADPGHHPPGRSVLHVATMANGALWLGLDEPVYQEKKRELEEYFIERLAEAIPDVRERIEVCETGTPHTMQRYSWNPGGSIYGYAYTPSSHSVFRPQPRTSVPGLYLAGAWTFPGAGFTGSMLSGYNTAKLVFEDVEGRSRPS